MINRFFDISARPIFERPYLCKIAYCFSVGAVKKALTSQKDCGFGILSPAAEAIVAVYTSSKKNVACVLQSDT